MLMVLIKHMLGNRSVSDFFFLDFENFLGFFFLNICIYAMRYFGNDISYHDIFIWRGPGSDFYLLGLVNKLLVVTPCFDCDPHTRYGIFHLWFNYSKTFRFWSILNFWIRDSQHVFYILPKHLEQLC